jgi:hypothetical protein
MYQPLVPCPACARHVRAVEAQCPFCSHALPRDLAAHAVPGTTQRLSRAAAVLFGTSLALAGCGGAVTPAEDLAPADAVADDGGPAPLYGLPPPSDAAPQDAAPRDDGGPVAAYGAPAPVDAGPDDNGGGSADYGAPPVRDGG